MKESFPKISVIVPVYNVESYLRKSLSSLAAQTYQNLEVILIDDGSTDRSAEICKEFVEAYPHFHYFYQENAGVSAARNAGIERASGELFAFFDSDDFADADMYELLVRMISDTGADIAACQFVAEQDGKVVCPIEENDKVLVFSPREEYRELLFIGKKFCGVEVWDKLFRRELFEEIRFPEGIAIGEDAVCFFDLLLRAETFAYCRLCKYHYILRPDSACKEYFRPSYWTIQQSARMILERTVTYFPDAIPQAQGRLINENFSLVHKLCAAKLLNRKNYLRVKREVTPCVNRASMKLLPCKRRLAMRLFLMSRGLFLLMYKLLRKSK